MVLSTNILILCCFTLATVYSCQALAHVGPLVPFPPKYGRQAETFQLSRSTDETCCTITPNLDDDEDEEQPDQPHEGPDYKCIVTDSTGNTQAEQLCQSTKTPCANPNCSARPVNKKKF